MSSLSLMLLAVYVRYGYSVVPLLLTTNVYDAHVQFVKLMSMLVVKCEP